MVKHGKVAPGRLVKLLQEPLGAVPEGPHAPEDSCCKGFPCIRDFPV